LFVYIVATQCKCYNDAWCDVCEAIQSRPTQCSFFSEAELQRSFTRRKKWF